MSAHTRLQLWEAREGRVLQLPRAERLQFLVHLWQWEAGAAALHGRMGVRSCTDAWGYDLSQSGRGWAAARLLQAAEAGRQELADRPLLGVLEHVLEELDRRQAREGEVVALAVAHGLRGKCKASVRQV